jgi:NCS1 family nucleobase:cation symporter-1
MVSNCLNLHVSSSHPNLFLANSKIPKLSKSNSLTLSSSAKLNKTNHAQNHSMSYNVSMRYSNSKVHFSSPRFEIEPDPTLINDDLKPTTPSQRTFSGLEMASLWVGLVVGVPSYYLAGSLVDLGMAWWQGIATVVAANMILFVPLVLTGHPGT